MDVVSLKVQGERMEIIKKSVAASFSPLSVLGLEA
jgi:hypothetical protein